MSLSVLGCAAKDQAGFFPSSKNGLSLIDLQPCAETWLLNTSNFRSSYTELRFLPQVVLCEPPFGSI
jgi:hypothetical protein